MATLMKATQPHWQGNNFVPAGTVLPPSGGVLNGMFTQALPAFFEPFEVDETPPPTLQDRARELGIKRVGSKSDETLAAEIAAAETGDAADEHPEASDSDGFVEDDYEDE